jgi:hypothetical protein
MSAIPNIVLPTRWIAEVLQHRSNLISSLLNAEPLSWDAASRMTQTALVEVVNQRRAWVKRGVINYSAILDQSNTSWVVSNAQIVLPELTGTDEQLSVHDAFMCYLLDNLIHEIEKHLLNPHYPEVSFDLLTIVQLDSGDTVLQNLGDYRIWRFEQLREQGKVTY